MIQTALLGYLLHTSPFRFPKQPWFWASILCVFTLYFIAPASYAEQPEDITPSHVFQETQHVINELVPLLKMRNVRVATIGGHITDRQPRHAWQKAREVLEKTQALQKQEGLSPLTLPVLYIKKVRPSHVFALMQKTRTALQTIRMHSNLHGNVRAVQFKSGKTPSDVFNNLALISVMLDSLLGTTVTPSHVVQMVSSTNLVLRQIYEAEKKPVPDYAHPTTVGKSPRQVYMLARNIMKSIQAMAARPRYQIEGGVTLVKHQGGRITPTDVISITQIILADMQAIGATAGITETVELSSFKTGKTPSDAYNQLLEAQILIQGLL